MATSSSFTERIWGELHIKLPKNMPNCDLNGEGNFKKIIPLSSSKFTIGRSPNCNYALMKKCVSNNHCYIKCTDGKAEIFDTSKNGTLINKTLMLSNGQAHVLEDKDEIYLITKGVEPYKELCFIFRYNNFSDDNNVYEPSEKRVKLEPIDVHENECTVNVQTQEDGSETDNDDGDPLDLCKIVYKPSEKRVKLEPIDVYENECTVNVQTQEEGSETDNDDGDPLDLCKVKTSPKSTSESSNINRIETSNTSNPSNSVYPSEDSKFVDTSATELLNSDSIPQNSDTEEELPEVFVHVSETEATTSGTTENSQNSLKTSENESSAGSSRTISDGIEEALQCSLCFELLHDPVCVSPCLHCYCSGCYTQWAQKSQNCPQCRVYIKSSSKNHIVSNLVEAYLKSHPEKKRLTVTKIHEPKLLRRKKDTLCKTVPDWSTCSLPADSDDERDARLKDQSTDSSSSDELDTDLPYYTMVTTDPLTFHIPGPIFKCQQCPKKGDKQVPQAKKDNAWLLKNQPSTSASGSTNNSSNGNECTKPVNFICKPNQSHITCQCCQQLMPDRRIERYSNQEIPPQQCSVCSSQFCNLYFDCQKQGCNGCLVKFKDLKFNDLDLLRGINDNVVETRILLDYLTLEGKDWKTCFNESLEALDFGTYVTVPSLKSDSIVCNVCGMRQLKYMLYMYRRNIPKTLLPNVVQIRPDCYWGNDCRTQKHKMSHAEKYNHVCERTRFRL